MKNFIYPLLICLGLVTSSLSAKTIEGEHSFANFEAAEKAAHLTWIVESTKVGLFSSDVYGYVLNYQYSGDYDEQNQILRNLTVSFPITAMNSDSEARDTKLHTLCMGSPTFSSIKVTIPGPIFLKEKRKREYQGSVFIRGKQKPFTIKAMAKLDGEKIIVGGESQWSLQKMEIPDPSIAVAKLSDEIRLRIQVPHTPTK